MMFDRRQLLASIASGLPLMWLRGGMPPAHAAPPTRPQFLILSSAPDGDPMNANCPGSCEIPGVHNNPGLPIVDVDLGAVRTRAAEPWATLPTWVRDRTTFLHHQTYQNNHAGFDRVLELFGNARSPSGVGIEQIGSIYSAALADPLATLQPEPVPVFGTEFSYEGRALPATRPTMLQTLFAPLPEEEQALQALRDQTLDAMHTRLSDQGTAAQRSWLDFYANSRSQARQIDEALLDRFASLNDDGELNQALAAVTLIMMRVSPVVAVRIGFGGDNHVDPGLANERDATLNGIATLNALFAEIDRMGLRDDVTVANLHVFGRTLGTSTVDGRNHNLAHHVMAITGSGVNPGVVGGIAPFGNDWGATAIDSQSGRSDPGGDVAQNETLEAACKTLGAALGIEEEWLDDAIVGGRVIAGALAP